MKALLIISLLMVGCSSYPCEYVKVVGYIESKEYVLVKCSVDKKVKLKNENTRTRSVVY